MAKQNRQGEMVKRSEDMQALYEKVLKNNEDLRAFLKRLPTMSEEITTLTAYYLGPWYKEREFLERHQHPVRDLLIFAEDPIFDEIQEWDRLLSECQTLTMKLQKEFQEPHQEKK